MRPTQCLLRPAERAAGRQAGHTRAPGGRGRRSLLAAAAAAALAAAPPARAQAWKSARPVTVVVPFGAGSRTDAITRVMAGLLEPEWGQPVVVENRAGADGSLAAAQVTCAVLVGACERPLSRSVTRIDTCFGAVQSGAFFRQARAVDGRGIKPLVIPRCLPARPAV